MTLQRLPAGSTVRERPWTVATAICLAWMAMLALSISRLKANDGMLVAILAALPVVCTFMDCVWNHLKPKAGVVAPRLRAAEGAGNAPSSGTGAPGSRSTADVRADLGELIRSRKAELRLVSPDVGP
jgi:hypothetical protein